MRWKAGSATVLSPECTTTIRALRTTARRSACRSLSRAATDSEPVASQPAPDSAVSTLRREEAEPDGDEQPSAIATVRKCVAV